MNLFIQSYIGMYLTQSILHAALTLYIIELSIQIWKLDNPRARFWYRTQAIVLPLLMFPVFQWINPSRGSFYYIEDTALFSSLRWLGLELWGRLSMESLFWGLLCATSLLTLAQEALPVIQTLFSKSKSLTKLGPEKEIGEMVDSISQKLKISSPLVQIVESKLMLSFTKGIKKPTIFLSTGLLQQLDAKQTWAVLSHEMAHIKHRSNYLMSIIFFLRIIMFFNPVSLLVFRRIIQDEEEICDDLTVSITLDPHALASSLKTFIRKKNRQYLFQPTSIKEALETSGQNLLLKERIVRLEKLQVPNTFLFEMGKYIVTLITIVTINYFVV